MSLLSPTDQQRLRAAFAEMTKSVKLVFVTQTVGCETCAQARQILDELPPLSERITIEETNLVLEPDTAKQFGITDHVSVRYTRLAGKPHKRLLEIERPPHRAHFFVRFF